MLHPQSLLSSSDAPRIDLKMFQTAYQSDKDKIIAVQEELIKNLQKQVGWFGKTGQKLEDVESQ